MRVQPWFAWLLAFGCLGWQLVARVGIYLSAILERPPWSLAAAITGTAAIAALVLALVPMMWGRGPRYRLLAMMAPLMLIPFAVGGPAAPVGLGGLLAAAILLTMRPPASWPLFGAVILADAFLSWLFSNGDPVTSSLGRIPVTVIVGLTLFAVARLAQLVTAANETRQRLARAEANAERLRATGRLSAGLGGQLSELVQRTRDAAAAAAPTRVALGDISGLAHRATAAARQVATARTARAQATPARPAPEPTSYPFAWWVSLALIISYSSIVFFNVGWSGGAAATSWTLVGATTVAFSALQLYHGTPRPAGANPGGWRWTIAAQLSLAVFITVVARPEDVIVLWFLMAGAIVTRASRRWSWLIVPAVLAIYGFTIYLPHPGWDGWASAYFTGTFAVAIISVYALCTLPILAERLHQSRADLARTAVVTEQIRFARDIHDLLGFHLSAIALKVELATRALDTDLAEAHRQLREIQRSAERALTEIRSINDVAEEITARAEQTAARSLLTAAGVRVSIDAPAAAVPGVDHLIGIIIREAATNVIRHARARYCTIRITIGHSAVTVSITNDGVLPAAGVTTDDAGTGVASLTSRAEAVGGELTAAANGDTFNLTARLPVRWEAPTSPDSRNSLSEPGPGSRQVVSATG